MGGFRSNNRACEQLPIEYHFSVADYIRTQNYLQRHQFQLNNSNLFKHQHVGKLNSTILTDSRILADSKILAAIMVHNTFF